MFELVGWALYSGSVGLALICIYYLDYGIAVDYLLSLCALSAVFAYFVVGGARSWRSAPSPAAPTSPAAPLPVVNYEGVGPLLAAITLYMLHLLSYVGTTAFLSLFDSRCALYFTIYLWVRVFISRPLCFVLLLATGVHISYSKYLHNQIGGQLETSRPVEDSSFFSPYDYSALDFVFFLVILAYERTFSQKGAVDGSRRWELLRRLPVWDVLARYFDFSLVGEGELDPQQTYLYGFHPHGIYPYTCIWGSLTSQWRRRYPGVAMDAFVASVIMMCPLLRDIGMALGARAVTREAIEHALTHKRSAIIVAGGQAEMNFSKSSMEEVQIVAYHKGFVRIAVQTGRPLVPVYNFGEHNLFDNVDMPSVQGWFRQRWGFGYPHFPFGRWLSPIPRNSRLALVVGQPVPVPALPEGGLDEHSLDQLVDRVHSEYFRQLASLFDRHKKACGFPNLKMNIIYDDPYPRGKKVLAQRTANNCNLLPTNGSQQAAKSPPTCEIRETKSKQGGPTATQARRKDQTRARATES